ncbi:MAG: PIN domain-containing protein [Novosphingobium sp.]
MTALPFLDSNILIYAYGDDPRKQLAQSLCGSPHMIGIQTLNEFASVARRKLQYDWDHIRLCLQSVQELAERIVPLTFEVHDRGLALAERHNLQIYDGMVIAAALEAGCKTLYSEDMQDGMVVDSRLTIRNPFA